LPKSWTYPDKAIVIELGSDTDFEGWSFHCE